MMELGILEQYPHESFESSINISFGHKWPVQHVDFIDQLDINQDPIYSRNNLQVAVKFDEEEMFTSEADFGAPAEVCHTPESAPCTVIMLDTGESVNPKEITNSAPKLLLKESDECSTLKMTADLVENTIHPEVPSQLLVKDDQTVTGSASAMEVIGGGAVLQSSQSGSGYIGELSETCRTHEEQGSVLASEDPLANDRNAGGGSLMCLEHGKGKLLSSSRSLTKRSSECLDSPGDTVMQKAKIVCRESNDGAQKLKGNCLQHSVPRERCLRIAPIHDEIAITSPERDQNKDSVSTFLCKNVSENVENMKSPDSSETELPLCDESLGDTTAHLEKAVLFRQNCPPSVKCSVATPSNSPKECLFLVKRDSDCHKQLTCAKKSEDNLDKVSSPLLTCPKAASNSIDCKGISTGMEVHCTSSTLNNQSFNVGNESGTLNACCMIQAPRPPALAPIYNQEFLKIKNSISISDTNGTTKQDQPMISKNTQSNLSLTLEETKCISDCLKVPCEGVGHIPHGASPQRALVPYVDIFYFLARSNVPDILSVQDKADSMSSKMKESNILKGEPWTVLERQSVKVIGDKPIELKPLFTSCKPTSLDHDSDGGFMECCANDKQYKLETHSLSQLDSIITPLIKDPWIKCDEPAGPSLHFSARSHNLEVPNVETSCVVSILNHSECIPLKHEVSGPLEPILEEPKKPFLYLEDNSIGLRPNVTFVKPSSNAVICNLLCTPADTGLTQRLQEVVTKEIQPQFKLFMENSMKHERKERGVIRHKRGLVEIQQNISRSKVNINDKTMLLMNQQHPSVLTKDIPRQSACLPCFPTQQAKIPKICIGKDVHHTSPNLLCGIHCLCHNAQSCFPSPLRQSRKKAELLSNKSQVGMIIPLKKQPSRKCKGLSVLESLTANHKTHVIKVSEPLNAHASANISASSRILPTQNVVSNGTSKPIYVTNSCIIPTCMKPTVLQKYPQDQMLLRKLSTIANRLSAPCKSATSFPNNLKVIPYGGVQLQARKLLKVFSCVNMKISCPSGQLWQESLCLTSSRDHLLSQYLDLSPASLATACVRSMSDTFSLRACDSPTFPVSFHITVNPSFLTDFMRYNPPDYMFNSPLPSPQPSQVSEWTLSLLLSSHMPAASENVQLLTQWNPHFKSLESSKSNSTYRRKPGCSMLGLHTVLALSSPGCYRLWTRKRNLGSRIPTIQKLSVTQFAHGLTRLPQQMSVKKETLSSLPFVLGRILSIWSRHGLSAVSSNCSTPHPHCSVWPPSQNIDMSAEVQNLPLLYPVTLSNPVNLGLPFDFSTWQDNDQMTLQNHNVDRPVGLNSQQDNDSEPSRVLPASAQTCSFQQQESLKLPCAQMQNSSTENKKEELKRKTQRVSQIRIRRTVPKPDPNLTPMGLPKPKRLNKKQFSLEDIYTNKNYKAPPPVRHLETIFEEPIVKNGVMLSVSQQKKKRVLEFRDYTVPRFNRTRGKVKAVTCCKRGRKAALQGEQIEALLSQKLRELENCLEE